MFNWFTSAAGRALKDTEGPALVIAIILVIALAIGLAALGFWLFTWAVATLFHFTIDFTFINWCAFVVLTWSFGRGGTSSSSD
jgi:hypothetical protein